MSTRHVAILEAYQSGKGYRTLAKEFGLMPSSCRRIVLIANSQGIAAVERMKDHACAGKPTQRVLTKEAYDRRWMTSLMKLVAIDANGCWRYQGTHTPTGYGTRGYRNANHNVHRIVYTLHFRVTLETEQYVLHRCDVRDCCNPEHLFIGSAKVNNNDCATKGRHYEGSREFCEQGHPLTGDNVRIGKQSKPRGGIKRQCIACEKIRMKTPKYIVWRREYQRRRRAEKRAAAQTESR